MKERIETVVDDVFGVLLFGLPQGMLFGVVWIVYTAWATLQMRSAVSIRFAQRALHFRGSKFDMMSLARRVGDEF